MRRISDNGGQAKYIGGGQAKFAREKLVKRSMLHDTTSGAGGGASSAASGATTSGAGSPEGTGAAPAVSGAATPGSSAPNIGFEHSDAPASAERGHPCPVKAAQMRSHRTITHNRAASPPVPVHPAPAFRLFELPVRSLACLRLDVPPR